MAILRGLFERENSFVRRQPSLSVWLIYRRARAWKPDLTAFIKAAKPDWQTVWRKILMVHYITHI